jgi:hypothetical protein
MVLIKAIAAGKHYTLTELPLLLSYDSGYEHSLEHLHEVRQLVSDSDCEFIPTEVLTG